MSLSLLAFFCNQTGRLKTEDLSYDALNLLASALLISYAWPERVWPFLILNSIWGLVSLHDVVVDLAGKKHLKLKK